MFELYKQLHPEDTDIEEEELELVTLENVFTIDCYNDLCFVVKGKLIILVEHQSTINVNMPLRMLLYVTEEYKRLIASGRREALFEKRLHKIVRPEFYVVYTGEGEFPKQLKLSDAFLSEGENFLELKVNVIMGSDHETLLGDFITFIRRIHQLINEGFTAEQAILQTIKEYEEGRPISRFLKENEREVMNMLNEQITYEDLLRIR